MKLRFQKLDPRATMPQYATPGAACFDLHAVMKEDRQFWVLPDAPLVVSTGLAFEVPPGHVMLIFSRSGHGFKNAARLANCVGVIDSDYRGEVKIKLTCDDRYVPTLGVQHGDRVAQAMLVPYPQVSFIETETLTATERGVGGFGSTGA